MSYCPLPHSDLIPGTPPPDQVHPPGTRYMPPQDQVQPPRTRYTPWTRYTPRTRYIPYQVHTCRDQVHPPGPGTPPWDQVHPPGPGTPPGTRYNTLKTRYTPRPGTPPLGPGTPPRETVTVADGTHPTGMHSCSQLCFIVLCRTVI